MPLVIPDTTTIPQHVAGASITDTSLLRALPTEALDAELNRVQNSIAHLRRSNDELQDYIHNNVGDDGETAELQRAREENEGTIGRQTQLITRLSAIIAEKRSPGNGEETQPSSTQMDTDPSTKHDDQNGIAL